MLAHAWSLLVMPNTLVWTELMIFKSIWQEMGLEGVGGPEKQAKVLGLYTQAHGAHSVHLRRDSV